MGEQRRTGRACRRVMLLCWALAGCVPAITPTVLPAQTPSATSLPPTASPTAVPPGPLAVNLTLWVPEELSPYQEGPAAALLAQHLAEFSQAYPNLQIEVIVKKAQGRGGLLDFLRTASAAAPRVLPDLVVLSVEDMRVAAQAGLLQSAEGLLPANLAADGFPLIAEMGQVGGQRVGVPLAVELEHLAYHPALYASPPVSWTPVLSSGVPFVFPAAGRDGGVNDFTLVQYLGAEGQLTAGEGEPLLEEEPLMAVLDFYAQAVSVGVVSPSLVLSLTSADGCWQSLQDGQAGAAVVGSRRFWSEPTVGVAAGPIPTRTGRPVALARGWVLSLVTADPVQQEWAQRLAVWLLDPRWQGEWTQALDYLPATRSGLAAWRLSEDERAVLEHILEGARPVPPASVRAAVGVPLQTAVRAVLEGRSAPAEAAAEAVRAVRIP